MSQQGADPATPPPQSRDATANSRYFSARPSTETILVPNSSPYTSYNSGGTYRPYQYTPSVNGISGHSGWSQKSRTQVDPLSRPSGFVASTDVNNANVTRLHPGTSRKIVVDDDGSDNEPPRKRINTRQTTVDLFDTAPDSPEVTRPGQKRKPQGTSTAAAAHSPPSSDELSPGPSKSRIVRGQRPNERAPATLDDDPVFTKFALGFAWYRRDDIKGAWRKCGGDERAASQLLVSSNYYPGSLSSFADPQPSPLSTPTRPTLVSSSIASSSSTPHANHLFGKVKEFEEEREAARAASKQKAAKSSIYKMRVDLDHKAPPTTTSPSSSTHVFKTDDSPVQPRRRGGRPRKLVLDSDVESSEDNEEGDDVDGGDSEVKRMGTSYEQRALQCLNNYDIDALREFTGTPASSLLCYFILWLYRLHSRAGT